MTIISYSNYNGYLSDREYISSRRLNPVLSKAQDTLFANREGANEVIDRMMSIKDEYNGLQEELEAQSREEMTAETAVDNYNRDMKLLYSFFKEAVRLSHYFELNMEKTSVISQNYSELSSENQEEGNVEYALLSKYDSDWEYLERVSNGVISSLQTNERNQQEYYREMEESQATASPEPEVQPVDVSSSYPEEVTQVDIPVQSNMPDPKDPVFELNTKPEGIIKKIFRKIFGGSSSDKVKRR
jgi:hypothetical protein